MSVLTLLLAAAAPQLAEVRTFQDWTVACDNGLTCEAVALLPENREGDGDWEARVTLMLSRGGRAADAPVLVLQGFEGSPAVLLADGRALPVRFHEHVDGVTVIGDERMLIDTLRSAQALEVRDAAGASLGRISLAGASAAMLYMDEKQRRLDTVTAMVRRGTRPSSAVPAPPALPRVRMAPPATGEPLELTEAEIAQLRRETGCTLDEVGGPDDYESEAIETGRTLILLTCGTGAYNLSSVPILAQRRGGRLVTATAPFDRQWALESEGHAVLINGFWDPDTRRLQEFSKGRGLGDCGTRAEYVWDGASFRLVHQEDMPECRGSLYYVTTWRAEAVEP